MYVAWGIRKLTMITQKEMEENITNLEAPGFPSFDEIIEYSESGQDKMNALEYEKAYHVLIEQVKDKTHDEQVAFLMSHMNELRNMVDLFSYARDMYMFPGNEDDEILANLMIYRYKNQISILDDEYCVKSETMLRVIRNDISKKRAEKKIANLELLKKEHPDIYEALCDQKYREAKRIAEGLDKLNKKIFEEHTIEELLEYDGSNLGRLL